LGIAVSTAAVALGATVIEKHFTLDRAMPGPDHEASLTVEELSALVRQIRVVEDALGAPEKRVTESELPIRALVRRSVTLMRARRAGEALQPEDIALLRPGTGIPPCEIGKVPGRVLKRDLLAGTTLRWEDLI
jgi:N,N'-diacetyllegionaminate synthase